MPEPTDPPPLDADTLDDILYLCRTGELDELKPVLSELCSSSSASLSLSTILSTAIDPISGNSTLHMAAANGHNETLKYLLEAIGCSSGQKETNVAAASGGDATRNDKEVHPLLNRRNDAGNGALHWAAVNGQLDAVKMLVGAGADPDLRNDKGLDAAIEAEAADREEVVTYLLSVGMDDVKDADDAEGENSGKGVGGVSEEHENGGGEQKMEGVETGTTNGNDTGKI